MRFTGKDVIPYLVRGHQSEHRQEMTDLVGFAKMNEKDEQESARVWQVHAEFFT